MKIYNQQISERFMKLVKTIKKIIQPQTQFGILELNYYCDNNLNF